MKALNLLLEEALIEKTGLPFYDAARLIGAAHLLVGTATAEAEDKGTRWVLRGPKLVQGRRKRQLGWVMEDLPAFAPSVKGLRDSVIQNVLAEEESASEPAHRGRGRKAGGKSKVSSVYFYLESALQTGTRGPDPLASYRNLASQAGTEFSQPLEEVARAALGVSFAAISRGARDDPGERRLLPVLGIPDGRAHLVLGPFLDFRRSFQHAAGGFVAAVWASLALLEDLVVQDLPVSDFAYNWVVPRVQSSSGYLGVDRVCRLMRRYKGKGREFHYVRQVRSYLAGTSWQGSAAEHDLARALAHFTTTAEVKHLETIVRLKARLMAREDEWPRRRAVGLFSGAEIIEEVKEMTGQDVDVPHGLTRALAQWFTGGGSDGWIGNFIKLENASGSDRFLDETERILSRARMHKDSPVLYSASSQEQEILQSIRAISGPAFRSLKAVFLLDVQTKMTSLARRQGTPVPEEQVQAEEVTNE